MDTYYAIFIGGPKDGNAIKVNEEPPSSINLPVRSETTYDVPVHNMDMAPYTTRNDMQIAVYRRQVVVGPNDRIINSKIRFYFFEGTL